MTFSASGRQSPHPGTYRDALGRSDRSLVGSRGGSALGLQALGSCRPALGSQVTGSIECEKLLAVTLTLLQRGLFLL